MNGTKIVNPAEHTINRWGHWIHPRGFLRKLGQTVGISNSSRTHGIRYSKEIGRHSKWSTVTREVDPHMYTYRFGWTMLFLGIVLGMVVR